MSLLLTQEHGFEALKPYIGKNFVVVAYGDINNPHNIAIECEDTYEVIMDFDNPDMEDENANGPFGDGLHCY